jgi:hypothetical protein
MIKNILIVVFILITTKLTFAGSLLLSDYHDINENNEIIVNNYIDASTEFNNFDEYLIQNNIFAEVIIDDTVIYPPNRVQEIKKYLQQIIDNLLGCYKKTLMFQYGNMLKVLLKLPYIGTGDHAYIFEILNEHNASTNMILKLNIKQYSNSLQAGMKESYNYLFWEDKAINSSFTVTKMHFCHPFGLYSIKEKHNGVSLTKVLIDKKLIFVVNDINNITSYKQVTNKEIKKLNIEKICTAIFDLLSIMKVNPSSCCSISPNNIFIKFKDDTDQIKNIELIDYGISDNKMQVYFKIETFNQYLEIATERLAKYLNLGYNI